MVCNEDFIKVVHFEIFRACWCCTLQTFTKTEEAASCLIVSISQVILVPDSVTPLSRICSGNLALYGT